MTRTLPNIPPDCPSAPCLACGSTSFCIKNLDNGFDIFKCVSCRLEFCQPMPSPAQLDAFYAHYKNPRATEKGLLANASRNLITLKSFGLNSDSYLLDYGCGMDAFRRAGANPHWHSYDPYTQNTDAALLAPGTCDWITLWGVLEHLPRPLDTLRRLAGLLKSTGQLALTTVSVETPIPFQHKPPKHLTYWTRAALQIALETTGFTLLACQPYIMVQHPDIYLNAVLRTVPEHYRRLIRHDLPDMVEVPTNEVFVVARRAEINQLPAIGGH